MIDYHLHTLFCNHSTGGMERYIQNAIDLGLQEICFLDHLTIQKAEPGPTADRERSARTNLPRCLGLAGRRLIICLNGNGKRADEDAAAREVHQSPK